MCDEETGTCMAKHAVSHQWFKRFVIRKNSGVTEHRAGYSKFGDDPNPLALVRQRSGRNSDEGRRNFRVHRAPSTANSLPSPPTKHMLGVCYTSFILLRWWSSAFAVSSYYGTGEDSQDISDINSPSCMTMERKIANEARIWDLFNDASVVSSRNM